MTMILAPTLMFIMTLQYTANSFMLSTQMMRHSHRQQMTLSMSSSPLSNNAFGRRDLIQLTGSIFTAASVLSFTEDAQAKDKEPVALETVRESFQAVRDELNTGVANELASLVDKEDYEQIMEFTKNYDLEFRKAKMGKARKFLTSKEDKEKGVLLCNAVTFDLIGMNKGSRPGQRNIEQVRKYYAELQADIQSFLDLEQNIDVTEYVSQ